MILLHIINMEEKQMEVRIMKKFIYFQFWS